MKTWRKTLVLAAVILVMLGNVAALVALFATSNDLLVNVTNSSVSETDKLVHGPDSSTTSVYRGMIIGSTITGVFALGYIITYAVYNEHTCGCFVAMQFFRNDEVKPITASFYIAHLVYSMVMIGLFCFLIIIDFETTPGAVKSHVSWAFLTINGLNLMGFAPLCQAVDR